MTAEVKGTSRMSEQHMDENEFVALAQRVLDAKGKQTYAIGSFGKPQMLYEDNIIRIISNFNGLALEIERKAQKDSAESHLRVSNPVTMVERNGEVIRHHGEHCYLTEHLISLAAELSPLPTV